MGGASPCPSELLLAGGPVPVLPGRGEESDTGWEGPGPQGPEWGFLFASRVTTSSVPAELHYAVACSPALVLSCPGVHWGPFDKNWGF